MTIKDEICPTVKVDARLLGDGTLWIKTDKIADIGRVIVEDGKTSCKQFYQDTQPEPCEDAVSRKTVKELMLKYGFIAPDMTVTEFVEDCLPPAQPAPYVGHWIIKHGSDAPPICDKCGYESRTTTKMVVDQNFKMIYSTGIDIKSNFCPNCGAKMEGDAKIRARGSEVTE